MCSIDAAGLNPLRRRCGTMNHPSLEDQPLDYHQLLKTLNHPRGTALPSSICRRRLLATRNSNLQLPNGSGTLMVMEHGATAREPRPRRLELVMALNCTGRLSMGSDLCEHLQSTVTQTDQDVWPEHASGYAGCDEAGILRFNFLSRVMIGFAASTVQLLRATLACHGGSGVDLIRRMRQHSAMPAIGLRARHRSGIRRDKEATYDEHLTMPLNVAKAQKDRHCLAIGVASRNVSRLNKPCCSGSPW
jgi:hypothetical protein